MREKLKSVKQNMSWRKPRVKAAFYLVKCPNTKIPATIPVTAWDFLGPRFLSILEYFVSPVNCKRSEINLDIYFPQHAPLLHSWYFPQVVGDSLFSDLSAAYWHPAQHLLLFLYPVKKRRVWTIKVFFIFFLL